jgi:hypothetical protein
MYRRVDPFGELRRERQLPAEHLAKAGRVHFRQRRDVVNAALQSSEVASEVSRAGDSVALHALSFACCAALS